ncbi:hypothetical protein GCM10028794_07510 [Silanimonas algicola]
MFDTLTDTTPHAVRSAGMNEPGIFKGCTGTDGPLAASTKDAILAYLGKPNASAWERLRGRTIAGRTTLGDAWALANPTADRRFPTSAELIRAIRMAVVAQWACNDAAARTH